MNAKVYVIPGSHAARTGILLLERKRFDLDVAVIPSGLQPFVLPGLGFPGRTVPAVKLDGRRIQGNREISRALDELVPEPPLFPADPERRRQVEEAERWGDEELQPLARRLALACAIRNPNELAGCGTRGRLGAMLAKRPRQRRIVSWLAGTFVFGVNDGREHRDRAKLPAMLQTVDDWIEAGVLGGPEPNAADCMIATSLCLLMYVNDLRPGIEQRPAGELAARLVPYPA